MSGDCTDSVKIDNKYLELKLWAENNDLPFTYEDYIKYFYPVFAENVNNSSFEDEIDSAFSLNFKLDFAKKLFITLSIKREEKEALEKHVLRQSNRDKKLLSTREKRLLRMQKKQDTLTNEIKALEEQFVEA